MKIQSKPKLGFRNLSDENDVGELLVGDEGLILGVVGIVADLALVVGVVEAILV